MAWLCCCIVAVGMSQAVASGIADTRANLLAEKAALYELLTDPMAQHESAATIASTGTVLGNKDFEVRRSGIAGAGRGLFALRGKA